MSLYIKGMEMPDRCFSCPMCDADCCGISKGSYVEYKDIPVNVAIDHRPDWCPLVPVPEHGRLICDRDVKWAFDDAILDEAQKTGRVRATSDEVASVINAIPTIIPTDKEGEG